MERAITCPRCGAPLAPHQFARSIVCTYCGTTVRLDEASVSRAKFLEAFRAWNDPESYKISSWTAIGKHYWAVNTHIAHGEIADVYAAQRARWPTELALLKSLRNNHDADLFENEWAALQKLHNSLAPGVEEFSRLIPQPIMQGEATAGLFSGRPVQIFRWESGFYHTFSKVLHEYPRGVPPRASIWIWRRILEILGFIHTSGMVHGAVLPAHLLVQENEHGVRLVGYGRAGCIGDTLKAIPHGYEAFYPNHAKARSTLTPQLDLVMSARCIAQILGGNPETADLPASVPAPLAKIIQRVALAAPADAVHEDAWKIRGELGNIANQSFGAPKFCPITMPI